MTSVYEWDENCQRIHDYIAENFKHIAEETGQLEYNDNPQNAYELLNYYKKWHYNNELFRLTVSEIISRKTVLEKLLNDGYGVSIDLAKDLETFLNREVTWYSKSLEFTFYLQIEKVKQIIYVPDHQLQQKNSWHIIAQLCRKLNLDEQENIPYIQNESDYEVRGSIDAFFRESRKIPLHANIATLLKMFLSITEESGTIMSGHIGNVNIDPAYRIKYIASRNIRELFEFMYGHLDAYINIDLHFIQNIHYRLTKDLDQSHSWKAGEIRTEDFENKSGLTFDFGNFQRGINEIADFTANANWDTDSFEYFIRQLVTLYYMLISMHPFLDSNGRTAKSLVNFLMLKRGLPPIIFDTYEEIPALHRYGGKALDMEKYFKKRIKRSVNFYFEELYRLNELNLIEKHFYNINFDSGFYFRQLNGLSPGIEISFKIYEVPPSYDIYSYYSEKCKITIPSKNKLEGVRINYAFTKELFGEWEFIGETSPNCFIYKGKDHYHIDTWEVTLIIPIEYNISQFKYLELGVNNGEAYFNNKGLNYRYELERSLLMKVLAQFIINYANSGNFPEIKALADRIEWRSAEAIQASALNENSGSHQKAKLLSENPDITYLLENEFVPLTLGFITENNLSGESDPSHADNLNAINHLIKLYLPKTAWVMDF